MVDHSYVNEVLGDLQKEVLVKGPATVADNLGIFEHTVRNLCPEQARRHDWASCKAYTPDSQSDEPLSELGRELEDIVVQMRSLGFTEEQIREAVLVRIGVSTDIPAMHLRKTD